MHFYYLTIFLFFIPALFETSFPKMRGNIQYKNYLLTGVVIVFIIQMGLRWETGTDWIPYLDHFNYQNIATPFTNDRDSFEIGYNFLVSITKWILPNYSFFLLIHAFIFFALLKKGYTFFTPYSLVALFLFYCTFMGVWGANRQFIAAGFGMLSLTYVYEKKWWKFGLFLVLASFFHTTAFLLIIFVFLKKTFTNFTIITLLSIFIIVGFSSLPFYIFSLFGSVSELAAGKATAYLENASENDVTISLIGLAKRIGIFITFFIYRERITKLSPKFNFIFNGYFVGLCFYFMFARTLAVMISRGSFYFNLLEPILISFLFLLPKDRKNSFYLMLILLVYSFLTIAQSISGYPEIFVPYKGIFINTDLQRNMH